MIGAMRLIKACVVALVLTMTCGAPLAAGPSEDASDAYGRGDYPTALRLLRPLAAQGNADAQVLLGLMYDSGLGVPQDYAEAVKWYQMAANQNSVHAYFALGLMYGMGHGVPQDYAVAATWFRQAAERGYPRGQALLGLLYEFGRGVPLDYVQAYKWYSLAVAGPESQASYHNGFIEKLDRVAAKMTPGQVAQAKMLASDWKPSNP
jgi:uncharacterized protein